ncbi:hypothetical protein S40285_07068 [Stachybotrys chlorohalonatus IBT 40285]|uniref:Uncharacterized protein n=1 Tax=Stachybotrys chlorohalonatus (strain IBT 40285) TaxID=1283841 RepID=A0A084QX52_STAC4|nr:hypothetical protein S40285_07068 [Stachybotrys chlorohalonata IBT 40285]
MLIWTSFNLENVERKHHDVLCISIDSDYPKSTSFFGDLPELAKLVLYWNMIKWNNVILEATLKFAEDELLLLPTSNLRFAYVAANGKKPYWFFEETEKRSPDHLVTLEGQDASPIVLVGIAHPAWAATTELATRLDLDIYSRHALARLAHLCHLANTKYGYVQGYSELVVCCFAFHENRTRLEVKLSTIPWTASGPRVMTADLALWHLSMMSLDEIDEKITTEHRHYR